MGPDLLLRNGADEPRPHGCLQTSVTALHSVLLPSLHPLPTWEEPCKLPGLPVKEGVRGQDGEEGKRRGKSKANPSLRAALPKEKGPQLPLETSTSASLSNALSITRSSTITTRRNIHREEQSHVFPDKLPKAKEEKESRLSMPPARLREPSPAHSRPARRRPPSCPRARALHPAPPGPPAPARGARAERPTVPVKANVQLFHPCRWTHRNISSSVLREPRLRRAR